VTATATIPSTPAPFRRERRGGHSSAEQEYQALWAMSRSERIEAMWRSKLTMRQLSKWSSRAPHEVPLLGGEFAWIAMHTPEWAEAADTTGVAPVPAAQPEVTPR
jgi:hypothetical protein